MYQELAENYWGKIRRMKTRGQLESGKRVLYHNSKVKKGSLYDKEAGSQYEQKGKSQKDKSKVEKGSLSQKRVAKSTGQRGKPLTPSRCDRHAFF